MSDLYYIVFTEMYEDPVPMRGPFPTFDAAVDAHYQAEIEAGNGPEADETAHTFYLHDDTVRIGRVL